MKYVKIMVREYATVDLVVRMDKLEDRYIID